MREDFAAAVHLIVLFYQHAPLLAWLALSSPFVVLLWAWLTEEWYAHDMEAYTYTLLPSEPAPLFTVLRRRGRTVGFETRVGRRVFGCARRVHVCRVGAKSGDCE